LADTHHEKLVIIGGGPAGYTAALYAARADLNPLVLEGPQPGGQLTMTTEVDNFPGFPAGIQGPELMELMKRQAERFGTRCLFEVVTGVDLRQRPFSVTTGGDPYTADCLIVATGASARWLGLESETRYRGFGVSACATCDAFFFRDKEVYVVGGGDTAAEESLFLTKFASRVTLVHRRDQLRASKILADRVQANDKITCLWDSTIVEILGAGDPPHVTGVRVKNVKSGAITERPADGIFMAIGHQPNTAFLNGQLALNPAGFITTAPHSTATSVPGVFACGDVMDPVYKQAITAAGTGCQAALDAEHFLVEAAQ